MLAYYSNDCFGIFTLSKSIIYANFSTPNRLSKFRLVLHMIVDCLCLLVKTCIILEILGYVKYNHTINTFIRSAKVAYFSILNLAYLTLLEVSVAFKVRIAIFKKNVNNFNILNKLSELYCIRPNLNASGPEYA